MTNLTRTEQKTVLGRLFPEATRIKWSTEYKMWDVTTIIGDDEYGDEVIDSYSYIPGTKKFRLVGSISAEI